MGRPELNDPQPGLLPQRLFGHRPRRGRQPDFRPDGRRNGLHVARAVQCRLDDDQLRGKPHLRTALCRRPPRKRPVPLQRTQPDQQRPRNLYRGLPLSEHGYCGPRHLRLPGQIFPGVQLRLQRFGELRSGQALRFLPRLCTGLHDQQREILGAAARQDQCAEDQRFLW